MGVLGSDARASGPISTVFLQPSLHLFESHPGFGYRHLLQRADAADTSAHKFLQSVHAAVGEQRTDVSSATISYEHR